MAGQMLSEKFLFKNKNDVVRLHLYTKLLDKGEIPYEKDLDVLVTLYEIGGYFNSDEQNKFFERCIKLEFKRTKQSIRNTLSKYTELGVLKKPKNGKRFFSDDWLPSSEEGKLVLDYKISHS